MKHEVKIVLTTDEAYKVVEALNHVYREIFDRSSRGSILIEVAQQIADQAKTGQRV